MASNIREILAAFANLLINDPVLTDPTVGILPSTSPDGLSASRANSIFYPRGPIPTSFPCVVVADIFVGPSVNDQQERKSRRPLLCVDVEVWGQSIDLGPITTEIDAAIEGSGSSGAAWWNGAMDTDDWQFNDIDSSGRWHAMPAPDETGSRPIERRVKTYWVNAADKTA